MAATQIKRTAAPAIDGGSLGVRPNRTGATKRLDATANVGYENEVPPVLLVRPPSPPAM
jgi:hypothetical protein